MDGSHQYLWMNMSVLDLWLIILNINFNNLFDRIMFSCQMQGTTEVSSSHDKSFKKWNNREIDL